MFSSVWDSVDIYCSSEKQCTSVAPRVSCTRQITPHPPTGNAMADGDLIFYSGLLSCENTTTSSFLCLFNGLFYALLDGTSTLLLAPAVPLL
eukprot:gene8156-5685_t